mgnify:CR=1 FL=1
MRVCVVHRLVHSLWSTAPFLLNNSVGKFNPSPSVEARMESFNDSIEKMLWPEKRDKDPILGDKVPGFIYRTTATSYIKLAPGFLPASLNHLLSWNDLGARWLPWLFNEEGVQIGPIPKGTPVNLLTNIDLESSKIDLAKLLLKMKADLKAVEGKTKVKVKAKNTGSFAIGGYAAAFLTAFYSFRIGFRVVAGPPCEEARELEQGHFDAAKVEFDRAVGEPDVGPERPPASDDQGPAAQVVGE